MSAHAVAKQAAADAALRWVRDDSVVGVGTGSTVNFFIDGLARRRNIRGAVSSSVDSAVRLRDAGIAVFDLNDVGSLELYVDGADESNHALQLIKGGGAALTREKIVASAAATFVCIVDDTKLVGTLGRFPLPVEVIPMARELVVRRIGAMGARALWRRGVTTDNGNQILDVHGLSITDPPAMERQLGELAGVVTVGLFALRPADVLLIGSQSGVRELRAPSNRGT